MHRLTELAEQLQGAIDLQSAIDLKRAPVYPLIIRQALPIKPLMARSGRPSGCSPKQKIRIAP